MDSTNFKGAGLSALQKINSNDSPATILKGLDIKPNKSLGQNFLRDNIISKAIVESLDCNENDVVIEIGPGLGALTQYLIGRVRKLILIEFDKKIFNLLNLIFEGHDDVKVINQDAVKFCHYDFFSNGGVKVIGNLPYSSGGEIIRNFLSTPTPVKLAVFMLQKEVADRYCSAPRTKSYCSNTVLMGAKWEIKKLHEMSSEPFYPSPKINSSVISFKPLVNGSFKPYNERVLKRVLKCGFNERRKQMKKRMPIGNYSWDHLCALVGINVQCRAEELDVNQWIELARLLDDNPFKDIPQKDSEIFDVVNSNDQVIKQMDRLTIHREGLLHRAVHVFVFNRFGELFLQKRSIFKDSSPGLWDSSCSGHLDTGENYDSAAVRELSEELGVNSEMELITMLKPTKKTGWEFIGLYEGSHNGPFDWPYSEIETGAFFRKETISNWIDERPQDFASGFIECFNNYKLIEDQ